MLNALILAAGVLIMAAGAVTLFKALWSDRARGRRRCPQCWYEIGSVDLPACPECGRPVRGVCELGRTRRRNGAAVAAIVVVLLGVVTARVPAARRDGWTAVVPLPVWAIAMPVLDPQPNRIDEPWLLDLQSVWTATASSSRWDRLRLAHRCKVILTHAVEHGISDNGNESGRVSSRVVHMALLRCAVVRPEGRIVLGAVERLIVSNPKSQLVRHGCLAPLQHVTPRARALRHLERFIEDDPAEAVRLAALQCTARVLRAGPIHREDLQVLVMAMEDASPGIRLAAASVLGWLGRDAETVLQVLLDRTERENDDEVRAQMRAAAEQIRSATAGSRDGQP
jgi:hypothetical protein